VRPNACTVNEIGVRSLIMQRPRKANERKNKRTGGCWRKYVRGKYVQKDGRETVALRLVWDGDTLRDKDFRIDSCWRGSSSLLRSFEPATFRPDTSHVGLMASSN